MTPEISERQKTVAAMKVDASELTARAKDEWMIFTSTAAAYNIVRLRRLLPAITC